MAHVDEQIHHKFKIFTGPLAPDGGLGDLARTVEDWVLDARVAAKSIGAEYLESAGRLILTVGYRDDEPAYPVAVSTVSMGQVDSLDADEVASLEGAMREATRQVKDIICHELFVTADHEFHLVLMSRG